MTRTSYIAAAFAGVLTLSAPAFAEGSFYPRVVGSGENVEIDYGPGPAQNIVGGGAVSVTDQADGDVAIRHREPRFAQPGREGVRAVTVGSGENQHIVWVPVDSAVNAATLELNATRG